MKKDNKVVTLPNSQKTVASTCASVDQIALKLYQDMLDGYEKYRLGTKRNTEKTVSSDLSVVKQLFAHSGKFPWEWKLGDWDDWNTDLVFNKGISAGTQRKYQGIIRKFLEYLITREVFQRSVKKHYNVKITQIIDEDEALHHIYESEQKEPLPAFTDELADQLFDALKQEIKIESQHPTRKLLNLQRDLALFYTVKATGLRIGSALALNIYSFSPNPQAPEMGKYGAYDTIGKGSKGSGPKPIGSLIDDIKLPPLLEWYINEIRPLYLKTNNPDEQALFLSERGIRFSYQSAWVRLQKMLENAGLSGINLCPHSFRRGKATESGMRYGVETTRRMLNHVYGTTTQGYMSVPDEFSQAQISDSIREQIKRSDKINLDKDKK